MMVSHIDENNFIPYAKYDLIKKYKTPITLSDNIVYCYNKWDISESNSKISISGNTAINDINMLHLKNKNKKAYNTKYVFKLL